eukprot:gene4525-17474_t
MWSPTSWPTNAQPRAALYAGAAPVAGGLPDAVKAYGAAMAGGLPADRLFAGPQPAPGAAGAPAAPAAAALLAGGDSFGAYASYMAPMTGGLPVPPRAAAEQRPRVSRVQGDGHPLPPPAAPHARRGVGGRLCGEGALRPLCLAAAAATFAALRL